MQSQAQTGIKTTMGRTTPSYAVLEQLPGGRYATYLRHHDLGGETRVRIHDNYASALARYEALEVAAA